MSASGNTNLAWKPDYQKRDYEVVDYQEYHLPGIDDAPLRGPEPDLSSGNYFSCAGAAQTHGIFVEMPYPALLAELLHLQALNLGQPAAGPGYFANEPEMIELINNGKFIVLQVMAARMESNRYYEAIGYRETLRDRQTGELLAGFQAWPRIFRDHASELAEIIGDCRDNWSGNYRKLIRQINVPIVLLWISHERHYEETIELDNEFGDDGSAMYQKFPQLVDKTCVEPLIDLCAGFAICNSTRGAGHELKSRFTGESVNLDSGLIHPHFKNTSLTHNHYYPSPEIHEDAAAEIISALKKIPGLAI